MHTPSDLYTHAPMPLWTHIGTWPRTATGTHTLTLLHAGMQYAHTSSTPHLPLPPHLLLHSLEVWVTAPLTGRGRTHLEVSVDDPHLVTMENSFQDLLDAVTMANSRQVSCGVLGWPGGDQQQEAWGKYCGTLGFNPQPGGARRMWGIGEGDAGHKGVLPQPQGQLF